jgi:eukaryotic-like serine/threonine-protein kinase
VEIGTTVGRYRIEEWLASGAMGEVYRAHDPLIDRPVAIKLVRRELISGGAADQWLERFKREARAAGQRFHPNIVTILDYGEEGGLPFLAMEFVDGPSLASLLKASGPLGPEPAVAIITQVLSGLGFAHDSGIIHRDIKPSNILVPANRPVKIADFGIARTDSSDLTVVGDILGTPAYLAPEQLRGDPVDNRSDLFAVAVMLFEVLTGVKPFRGKTLRESIWLMERRGPEDICALNPLVPIRLKRVIDRALAFDPGRRFGSAVELSQAIALASATAHPDTGSERATATPLGSAAPDASERSVWGAELLQQLERELATFIGPVAVIAVKQTSRATSDLGALCEALSHYIDNQPDRDQFRQISRRLAARVPELTSPSLSIRSTGGAARLAAAPLPPLAVLAEIENSLTRFIGPAAKVIVQRHLRNFETLPQLYRALAADIPSERDRAAFLDSLKLG